MINEIYYTVDDYRTYSKVDAFRAAQGQSDRVKFNFMESVFLHADWWRPVYTWPELLRMRCQQLRDKYDWLTLWFSGGWDSTTVLDAFVANQIPLDEILIYDRTWFNDVEVRPALEYAEKIKKDHMPDVKINFISVSDRHSDEVYDRMGIDWIFAPGSSVMYPKMHRYFLHHEVSETAKFLRAKRGEIHAQDKPRVLLDNGVWKNCGVDAGMFQYMQADCEFFYLSPDLPQLHVAQCHMAVDFFESLMVSLGPSSKDIYHAIQGNKFLDWRYEAWNIAIGRTCMDHPSARFGWLKGRQCQNPIGQESVPALSHAKDNQNRAWTIYQEGLHAISQITGLALPESGAESWLPTVLSRKWYAIRPVAADVTAILQDQ